MAMAFVNTVGNSLSSLLNGYKLQSAQKKEEQRNKNRALFLVGAYTIGKYVKSHDYHYLVFVNPGCGARLFWMMR